MRGDFFVFVVNALKGRQKINLITKWLAVETKASSKCEAGMIEVRGLGWHKLALVMHPASLS